MFLSQDVKLQGSIYIQISEQELFFRQIIVAPTFNVVSGGKKTSPNLDVGMENDGSKNELINEFLLQMGMFH